MYGKSIAGDFEMLLMLTSYFPLVKGEPHKQIRGTNVTAQVFAERGMRKTVPATFLKEDSQKMTKLPSYRS